MDRIGRRVKWGFTSITSIIACLMLWYSVAEACAGSAAHATHTKSSAGSLVLIQCILGYCCDVFGRIGVFAIACVYDRLEFGHKAPHRSA